jgi:hypothetical protein
MKYDPETSAIEFTVRVPVSTVAEAYEYVHTEAKAVPVAAITHLLEAHADEAMVNRIVDLLKDRDDFADALASCGLLKAA